MKKNKKDFIKRNEFFGYSVFDKSKLKQEFLNFEEFEESKFKNNPKVDDWAGDRTNLPKGLLYSPIRIYFDLTEDCNLACKTCYNSSGKKKPDELPTQEVINSLRGLRKDNVFDLRFSGGELTQRPDWNIILQEAKDLGFSVSANTNGVFDDSVVEKFTELDLEQITLSVDGSEKLHDYIRGKGTYQKVADSIKKLSNKGNTLRINSIITKDSIYNAKEILDLAVEYVQEINFFHFRPLGRAKKLLMDKAVTFEELKEFNDYLGELKKPYVEKGLNVLHNSIVTTSNSINEKDNSKYGLLEGSTDGFTRWNIAQNGNMSAGGYSLHIRPDLKMSNIVKEDYSLLNIWRNYSKLDEFRKFSNDYINRCKQCPEKNVSCVGETVEFALIRQETGYSQYCGLKN